MEITDKKLFLKYAIPCASTLVIRGDVKQQKIDELKNWVTTETGEEPTSEELHNIFKVASVLCTVTAQELGKDIIDSEVIHEYFLKKHDKIVEERWLEKQDFDKEKCKIRIVTLDENSNYKKDFCPDAKIGDKVVVHYDYIIEKEQI